MITITPTFTGASKWYANLNITLLNESDAPLDNPKIAIELSQPATASSNSGYQFSQTDNILNGTLDPWMLPIPKKGKISFSLGLNYPDGNNSNKLPSTFWVNGEQIGSDTGEISPPEGLTASAVTDKSLALSWTPSTAATKIDHYVVSYTEGISANAINTPSAGITLTGLKAGTLYTITVTAVDSNNQSSVASAPLSVKTRASHDTLPPNAPVNLRTTLVTSSSIGLEWGASSDNSTIHGYSVSYLAQDGSGGKLNISDTSCQVDNLKNNMSYTFSVVAIDNNGNVSAASVIRAATTDHSSATNVSCRPFVDVTLNAVWDDWQNYPAGRPGPQYSGNAIRWGVDGLIFGFITLSQDNTPCWAAQSSMPVSWAKPLADELQAGGLKTYVSFGGAANSDISMRFTVEQLVEAYLDTLDTLGAAGLDFDLENGHYNIEAIAQALQVVQSARPAVQLSFTLPVLPQGLTSTGMAILKVARDCELNFVVNGMAMDYYDPAWKDKMGLAAINAATGIKDQIKSLYPSLTDAQCFSRVAITPMIGLNDDLSMFTLADAQTLSSFAGEKGLSFISEWSLNRDNPSSYPYVDILSSSNPEQSASGEYAQRLKARKY